MPNTVLRAMAVLRPPSPMPPTHAPDSLYRKATERRAIFKDAKRTTQWTAAFIVGPIALDLIRTHLRSLNGLGPTVGERLLTSYAAFLGSPLDVMLLAIGVAGLGWTVHQFRHRNDVTNIVLPPFPPVPDLSREDAIFIGSGWTREGGQPGDVVPADTEILDDPHLVWERKGQLGNGLITAGVGAGKTEWLLKPMLYSIIAKYPKPDLPPHRRVSDAEALRPLTHEAPSFAMEGGFASWVRNALASPSQWVGVGGAGALGRAPRGVASYFAGIVGPHFERMGWLKIARACQTLEEAGSPARAIQGDPYEGLSPEAADALYEELLREHHERKCGISMIDLKGDLSEFALKVATLFGREDDIVILKPGGEWTYNPLLLSDKSLTQAELIMDGVSAVSEGGEGPSFWRSTQAEFLTNTISVLRSVAPNKCTFVEILKFARDEQLRAEYVGRAEALRAEQVREEMRLHALGMPYTGPHIDQGAIDFFRDFDNEEADVQMKRAVVQGIKSFAKYYVDPELRGFLNPELPPTFTGFRDVFDRGKLVILQMPLADFGPVGKVLGILTSADFMQVARRRITDRTMNQDRMTYLIIDEVQNYLSTPLRDFLATNRQSGVCFLGAHQSLGQLMRGNNDGYLISFLDNCRTKFVGQATNGGSGAELSRMLGQRPMDKISTNITAGLPSAAVKDVDAKGGTVGESVSIQEVEKAFFTSHNLMSLLLGQFAVLKFDGKRNHHPRMVQTQPFSGSHAAEMELVAHVMPETEAPHPVVWLEGRSAQDESYFQLFVGTSRFLIVHPLLDGTGAMGGARFTSTDGTLIVDLATLNDQKEFLYQTCADDSVKVVFPDAGAGLGLFWHVLEAPVASPIFLAETWAAATEQPCRDTWSLLAEQEGVVREWADVGAWDYHQSRQNGLRVQIQEESRAMLRLYRRTVGHLMAAGDGSVELAIDTFLRDIEAALPAAQDALQTAMEELPPEHRDADRAGVAITTAAGFSPQIRFLPAAAQPESHMPRDDADDDTFDDPTGSVAAVGVALGDDEYLADGGRAHQQGAARDRTRNTPTDPRGPAVDGQQRRFGTDSDPDDLTGLA